MGLPAIDQSLDKLLVAMEAFPNVAIFGRHHQLRPYARTAARPVRRLIRVLDDDARTARNGRDEAATHHRHINVHFIFIMDMLGSPDARQVFGSHH